MTAADREAAARRQRAQTIAVWRWALTEPAMDPALTARQRGQVVRELAAREHEGPSGRPVSVSRRTIDRWIVARRAGGFDALTPAPRQCAPRTDADVVELAAGLKMENPARTAAQVRRILAARPFVPAGSPAGDCLAVLEAVTAGLRHRFPRLAAVSAHEVAGHLTGGLWLAPAVPAVRLNTTLLGVDAVWPS